MLNLFRREELFAQVGGVEGDDGVAREAHMKAREASAWPGRLGRVEIGNRAHEGEALVVEEIGRPPASGPEESRESRRA
jgi:hypothetical protein